MRVKSGAETWAKALELATQGQELVVELPNMRDAKRFIARMGAAKARNRREMAKLFPEVTDGRDLSEWAGLGMKTEPGPSGRMLVVIGPESHEAHTRPVRP